MVSPSPLRSAENSTGICSAAGGGLPRGVGKNRRKPASPGEKRVVVPGHAEARKKRANFEGKRREGVRGSRGRVIAKICDRLPPPCVPRALVVPTLGRFSTEQSCTVENLLKPSKVDPVHAHSEQIKGCYVLDTCPKQNKPKAVFADEGWSPPLYNIWTFAKKTNVVDHFGNSEQRILENLLYLTVDVGRTPPRVASRRAVHGLGRWSRDPPPTGCAARDPAHETRRHGVDPAPVQHAAGGWRKRRSRRRGTRAHKSGYAYDGRGINRAEQASVRGL
jgi:hypothetical protein